MKFDFSLKDYMYEYAYIYSIVLLVSLSTCYIIMFYNTEGNLLERSVSSAASSLGEGSCADESRRSVSSCAESRSRRSRSDVMRFSLSLHCTHARGQVFVRSVNSRARLCSGRGSGGPRPSAPRPEHVTPQKRAYLCSAPPPHNADADALTDDLVHVGEHLSVAAHERLELVARHLRAFREALLLVRQRAHLRAHPRQLRLLVLTHPTEQCARVYE